MNTIGIRLADGTFYPIFPEGEPNSATLDLTTANDNQTTVMVDVYRSASGTMADAEYIDTLQIDNLVEHPNGELTISLTIQLDADNRLSATINDPESGAESKMTVSLVTRPPEARAEMQAFDIAVPDDLFDGGTSGDTPFPASFEDTLTDGSTGENTESDPASSAAAQNTRAGVTGVSIADYLPSFSDEVADTEPEDTADNEIPDDATIAALLEGTPTDGGAGENTESEPASSDAAQNTRAGVTGVSIADYLPSFSDEV
ncbi:MAG: Hsp70 family protein, partial [Treponema sp.]|nr:Hsp70 family protein [Treponema sp.]